MIEVCGMGGPELGLRQFRNLETGERFKDLSPEQLARLDRSVSEIIAEAQRRAAAILAENRAVLEALRELLIEKKTIDAKTLGTMAGVKGK
jgi:cell division protease FtsH